MSEEPMPKRPLTAKELAEALLALPEEQQNWPVETEGCDCYGTAGHVGIDKDDGTVYIGRALTKDDVEAAERLRQREEERRQRIEEAMRPWREKGLLPE
jgi:nicotinamide mononucleotide (NMN) deamidase PncC